MGDEGVKAGVGDHKCTFPSSPTPRSTLSRDIVKNGPLAGDDELREGRVAHNA